jgi:hypothetical protein|nr:MAG TPA: hypothetical protein [Caudoviricetes sp.]
MRKVKMEHRPGYTIELYVSHLGNEAEIYANGCLANTVTGENVLERAMRQYDRTVDYLDALMELPEYKKGLKKI